MKFIVGKSATVDNRCALESILANSILPWFICFSYPSSHGRIISGTEVVTLVSKLIFDALSVGRIPAPKAGGALRSADGPFLYAVAEVAPTSGLPLNEIMFL